MNEAKAACTEMMQAFTSIYERKDKERVLMPTVVLVLNDIEINQRQNTWVLASPVHMHLPPRALDLFFCLANYNLKRKLLAFVRFISLSHKVNNREATFCYLFVYS
jgi:hypothetical protein